MQTEPIQSNPSQGSSTSSPQLPPIDASCPPSFDRMLRQIEAVVEASTAKPGDPAFGSTFDQHLLIQSGLSISQLRYTLDNSPKLSDATYASLFNTLNRATALLERTRARIDRGEKTSARIALRQLELQNKEQRAKPERDEATAFLQAELAEGERPAKDIIKSARDLGISPRTLNRAKADMRIHCRLHHENKQRAWRWSLPASNVKPEESHQLSIATPASDTSPSALVPAASTAGTDHLQPPIIDHAASPNPATPIGPMPSEPVRPSSNSTQDSEPSHPAPSPHEHLRLPPLMATSKNSAGNLTLPTSPISPLT